VNAKAGRQEGFLTPTDKGDKPLVTYHVDHFGPTELTKKGYNHIFVIVDAFFKYVWLYPTRSTGVEEVVTCLERLFVLEIRIEKCQIVELHSHPTCSRSTAIRRRFNIC